MKAADKAYGGDFGLQKSIKGINYCMCGTVFEFKENGDGSVTITISFGGLLFVLSCAVELISGFKYG